MQRGMTLLHVEHRITEEPARDTETDEPDDDSRRYSQVKAQVLYQERTHQRPVQAYTDQDIGGHMSPSQDGQQSRIVSRRTVVAARTLTMGADDDQFKLTHASRSHSTGPQL